MINQIKRLEWFRILRGSAVGSEVGSAFSSIKSTWFRWFRIYPQLSHVCARPRLTGEISGTSGTTEPLENYVIKSMPYVVPHLVPHFLNAEPITN